MPLKTGDVANTADPVPVSSVSMARRLADDGVIKKSDAPAPRPDTPVAMGRPVQLVSVPDVGVPSAGVTSVGLVNSNALVNCLVVPPCTIASRSVICAAVATGRAEIFTFAMCQQTP